MSLAELKKHPEIISQIDWEITPWEAFETYQLRSHDNWRHSNLGEVVYFYLAVWKGEPKLYLIRRSLKQSEEIALIQAPAPLVEACLAGQEGEQMPRGHYALDESLKSWLRKELGG